MTRPNYCIIPKRCNKVESEVNAAVIYSTSKDIVNTFIRIFHYVLVTAMMKKSGWSYYLETHEDLVMPPPLYDPFIPRRFSCVLALFLMPSTEYDIIPITG